MRKYVVGYFSEERCRQQKNEFHSLKAKGHARRNENFFFNQSEPARIEFFQYYYLTKPFALS